MNQSNTSQIETSVKPFTDFIHSVIGRSFDYKEGLLHTLRLFFPNSSFQAYLYGDASKGMFEAHVRIVKLNDDGYNYMEVHVCKEDLPSDYMIAFDFKVIDPAV